MNKINITHFHKNDCAQGLIFKEVQNNDINSEMGYILFADRGLFV